MVMIVPRHTSIHILSRWYNKSVELDNSVLVWHNKKPVAEGPKNAFPGCKFELFGTRGTVLSTLKEKSGVFRKCPNVELQTFW